MTRQEIVEILRRARPQLAREFGVRRLALFGSYARDDQREDSDVDILVEVDPSIGLRNREYLQAFSPPMPLDRSAWHPAGFSKEVVISSI